MPPRTCQGRPAARMGRGVHPVLPEPREQNTLPRPPPSRLSPRAPSRHAAGDKHTGAVATPRPANSPPAASPSRTALLCATARSRDGAPGCGVGASLPPLERLCLVSRSCFARAGEPLSPLLEAPLLELPLLETPRAPRSAPAPAPGKPPAMLQNLFTIKRFGK